ncbi:hypothetical protein M0Q97_11895 [Candidatus Dojkabacteria bacterium]|jgi:hypothetical protein|nr:hypothetical protein [Candidatus Dojkabacteria bacterium]
MNNLFEFLSEHNLLNVYFNLILKIDYFFTDYKITYDIYKDEINDEKKLFIIINTKLNQRESFNRLVELRKNCPILLDEYFKSLISITTVSI